MNKFREYLEVRRKLLEIKSEFHDVLSDYLVCENFKLDVGFDNFEIHIFCKKIEFDLISKENQVEMIKRLMEMGASDVVFRDLALRNKPDCQKLYSDEITSAYVNWKNQEIWFVYKGEKIKLER